MGNLLCKCDATDLSDSQISENKTLHLFSFNCAYSKTILYFISLVELKNILKFNHIPLESFIYTYPPYCNFIVREKLL